MSVALPPRAVRRLLGPVILAVELALGAVCLAGTLLGAILAPFTRRRRLLRVGAFATGYLVVEIVTLLAAFGLWVAHPSQGRRREASDAWVVAHQRLLRWALGTILRWAGRCAGFRVAVETPAGEPDPGDRPGVRGGLDGDQPVLVLARHGGPGDSFALVHLLLDRYQRRVRIVLKDVLQLDPALDILLNRLDCCFLPSRAGAGEDLPGRLADLAGRMEGRDTLLVFPEGGNWTPGRRRRAIHRLRADGEHVAAAAATLMTHVLPPKPKGVLAVLDRRPDVPVVLVAHAGLDRIVTAGQAWRSLPLATPMTVRAWPAAPFPRDGHEEQLAWLTTEWAVVDEWIDAHRVEPAERSASRTRLRDSGA